MARHGGEMKRMLLLALAAAAMAAAGLAAGIAPASRLAAVHEAGPAPRF